MLGSVLLFGLYFSAVWRRFGGDCLEIWTLAALIFLGITSLFNTPDAFWTLHYFLAFYFCSYLLFLALRESLFRGLRQTAEGILLGVALGNAALIAGEHFFRAELRPWLVLLQGDIADANAATGAATGIFNGRTEVGAFYAVVAVYFLHGYLQSGELRRWPRLALAAAVVWAGSRNGMLGLLLGVHASALVLLLVELRHPVTSARRLGFLLLRYGAVVSTVVIALIVAPKQRAGMEQLLDNAPALIEKILRPAPMERGTGEAPVAPSAPSAPSAPPAPPAATVPGDQSAFLRTAVYREAFRVFQQRPWTGVGLRNLQYRLQAAGPNTIQAHNIWLNFLAETGLIGLLLILALLFVIGRRLASSGRLFGAAGIAMLVFFALMQFDYYLGHTSCLNLLFALIAALCAMPVGQLRPEERP